jgi:O-antigen/teichoic acid export membrane protein
MSASDALTSPGPEHPPIFLKTVSGFACQAWTALVSLICFPIFIHLLGMEAFGLIGFYLTLQMILRVLDLGLTPAVIREFARSATSPEGAHELAEKAATFETTFAISGGFIAVLLLLSAHWVAHHWLHSENIPPDTVALCVAVMAIQCGVSWLSAFYQNALVGLERQVVLYGLRVAEATLSLPGALALVFFTGSDIRLVFFWQLGIGVVGLCCYLLAFRRSLPTRVRPFGFKLDYLRRIRGFAAGMATMMLLGLVLMNMDKVFLSRFLSLEQFGNYSLAAYATATVYGVLVQPVVSVMFPRFSSLAARGEPSLGDIYHLTTQAFAMITGPVLIGMLLFARDFLEIWTRSHVVAEAAAGPVSWLAAGYTLNALMTGPHLLQIAHGWTSVGVKVNALMVAVFLPGLLLLTTHFGPNGAAANFAALNATSLVIGLIWTHTRILRGQAWKVLVADIGPTALVCLAAFVAVRVSPLDSLPISVRVAVGMGIVSGAFVLSTFASARTRIEVLSKLRSWSAPAPQAGGDSSLSVKGGKSR